MNREGTDEIGILTELKEDARNHKRDILLCAVDKISKSKEAINELMEAVKELLIAAKYCDEWLAEGINQEGVDEILKRIRKAIKKVDTRKLFLKMGARCGG